MSTPISTAAVVSWRHLDSKKFLAEADPTQQALTFKMRLEERSYFFEIWVPLYLKQRPKKIPSTYSSLILNIPLSTIETFSLHVLSTTDTNKHIPEPVAKKLKSSVLRLDIKLRDKINTIIPSDTDGIPLQGRKYSGVIFDNVRQISQAKSISIFIKHSAPYEAELHSFGEPINNGHYQSTGKSQPDLQSLYQGVGAKRLDFSTQSKKALGSEPSHLPAYKEVASPIFGRIHATQEATSGGTRVDEETQLRRSLEERLAIMEKEKRTAQLEPRLKTAEAEIESLQSEFGKFESPDGKIFDIEEDLNDLGSKYENMSEVMVTKDNMEDFGKDLLREVGRRMMGDDH
ncbi:unnamed protein product [Fusarium graminearum]|uniref:Chromosome 2, complete genome n=3 Tax=Gibberella zeae TaxID=5518 RepID=A0A098DIU8_GIBZE|nr:unnamed protein product [Fusarium graminearum]